MSKNILTPEQLEQFNEWTADGNASKIDDNIWLEQTTQWSKQFTTDELKEFFKREYLSESEVWESEDNDVKFIPYNGIEIMHEPLTNTYYANDVQFSTLEQAKQYADAGSPDPNWKIDAYRKGMFKNGGSVDMPPRSERKNKTLYHLIYIEGNDMGSMFFDNKKDAELKFDEEVKNGIEFIELSQDSFNEDGWLNNHNLYMVHDQFKNGGTTSKRYRVTNKKTGAIHFENASSPNHAILMVIKKVQMIYPNLTPNDFVASITEQYKDGGGVNLFQPLTSEKEEERKKLKENIIKALFIDKEFIVTEVTFKYQGKYSVPNTNKQDIRNMVFEINQSKQYPPITIFTNRNGVLCLDVPDKMETGGGVGNESGLHDYKIGDFAWIRKADYNEIYGQIIDIRNFEMAVNLGQDIKGSQTEIYATIVDENGKEHSGQLMPKNYSNGGSIKEQNYDMIQSDNQAIMHHTKELDSVLKTNRTIPAWALALVNQSSQNLSKVTHYLEGAKKFATGGVSPQMYGQDVTFLDINGNEQIGMVQEMDENGAELFYEERFMKVPTHRIVKFN